MSELEIEHGGAIVIDPDALREVGRRIDAVSSRCDEARDALIRAHRVIVDAAGLSQSVDTVALWGSADAAGRLREECADAAGGTLLMADVFEYVELQVTAEALAAGDDAAADEIACRMDALLASDPRIADMAVYLIAGWEADRFEGLDLPFPLDGAAGHLFAGAALVGVTAGLGRVTAGMTLTGRADPVSVTPVRTSSPTAPPAGIPGSLNRMAHGTAQIAVEKYTFADGRTRFVAYLKGTQSVGSGGSEPWDMKSNAELYSGRTSASYQATLDALTAAGARPGDTVDVVAHSQSGMIAAHLSMESGFDVRMQITAGSPVEPTLSDDQTIVQLRHSDEPVSALAGGGSPAGTGSPDSVTVSRVGDPSDGMQDLALKSHALETYVETAKLAEKSGDPRIDALDGYWDELAQAEVIERTEYRAERVG